MLWPLQAAPSWYDPGRQATAAVYNRTATPSGTAHAKGAWTQVVSALEEDASLVVIRGNGAATSGSGRAVALDLGVGAASSEQVVLEGFDVGQSSANPFWIVPISVPAGERVAVRVQSAVTNNCLFSFDFYGSGGLVGGGQAVGLWTTYGFNAAGSTGTAVTPGNSNAWGSWTQIGSTTSSEHDVWMFTGSMGANSATTSIVYRTQFAFAADATEAGTQATNDTMIEGPFWSMSTGEARTMLQLPSPFYNSVPSGMGIWARAMASGTAQTVYLTAFGGN